MKRWIAVLAVVGGCGDDTSSTDATPPSDAVERDGAGLDATAADAAGLDAAGGDAALDAAGADGAPSPSEDGGGPIEYDCENLITDEHRLPIDAGGAAGELEIYAGYDGGNIDGMGVDACGNVYLADVDWPRVLVDAEASIYMRGLNWGVGPWGGTTIYVSSGFGGMVWGFDIGIPSKPRAFP